MKTFSSVAAAAALLAFAMPASAQFAKPEDAVKYRQSAFAVMSQHFSRIGAMTKGKIPFDAKLASMNADIVAELARLPMAGFLPATASISPKVKSDAWEEMPKFREHGEKMVSQTAKLAAAAKTNNLDNLKAAFGEAAATCKACHDSYKD